MDFVLGIEVKLSNNHTLNGVPFTDICDELKGKYPKDFKFTGWHPLCRCHAVPILKKPEDFINDMNNGTHTTKGEITSMPIKFNDWVKSNESRINNSSPDKLPYFLKDNQSLIPILKIKDNLSNIDIIGALDYKKNSDRIFMHNGKYLPNRAKMHDEIIDKYLSQEKVNSEKVYILGGAPANGKSSVVESGELPHPKGALVIDPDKVKSMIPEYNQMINSGNKTLIEKAASFVHEESSYLGKKIQEMALKSNYGTIIDGVNDGSFESVVKKIKKIREISDKPVRVDYVSLDTELSKKLATICAKKTGRTVPMDYIEEMNKEISLLVPKLLKNNTFDELFLWDTNMEGKPRLILKQVGGKLKIFDEELYQRFLKKAN